MRIHYPDKGLAVRMFTAFPLAAAMINAVYVVELNDRWDSPKLWFHLASLLILSGFVATRIHDKPEPDVYVEQHWCSHRDKP